MPAKVTSLASCACIEDGEESSVVHKCQSLKASDSPGRDIGSGTWNEVLKLCE
jgi:hypothetical protein